MIRLSALAAITAATALLVTAAPSLAQAGTGPSAFTPEVKALMATQDKLHKIAEKVERSTGFSGFYVDAGGKTLNVYWKGKAPAKVNAAAAVAKAQGLTVKVHSARYSEAELKAEAARLAKTGSIQSIAAKYDGSGLVAKQASAGFSAKSAVQSSVAVEVESGEVELAASRLVDSSPYKGGAYIENYANGIVQGACSSGFAVTSNATGADKFLTAAHCGDLGSYYTNGNLDFMGSVESRSVASDSEIINATGQARVWIGDSIQTELNQPTANQYGLDVIGSSATIAGDWLCDSGSFSGTICDIRATQTGLTICLNGFGCVNNSVEAVHQGGYSAGGNGDSGGPVFSVQQPGDRLVARGTLTAISVAAADLRQCSGVPAENGRRCSQRIIFPDIVAQMADHNVRIKTIG
ncbi:hypothetical protein [Lentzea sp.]|uniref:hypothetical protein n=1 Tax=Lentzea sp. TaxID=56099 RepID=UPI002BA8CE22|nr:hypothetical protein [Lentzea sp.]HUQ61709.1 hypothetical protein [Lentzea sp.]